MQVIPNPATDLGTAAINTGNWVIVALVFGAMLVAFAVYINSRLKTITTASRARAVGVRTDTDASASMAMLEMFKTTAAANNEALLRLSKQFDASDDRTAALKKSVDDNADKIVASTTATAESTAATAESTAKIEALQKEVITLKAEITGLLKKIDDGNAASMAKIESLQQEVIALRLIFAEDGPPEKMQAKAATVPPG